MLLVRWRMPRMIGSYWSFRSLAVPGSLHGHIDAKIRADPEVATATIWQRLADQRATTVAYPTLRADVTGRRLRMAAGNEPAGSDPP